jgi:hypothetical protein
VLFAVASIKTTVTDETNVVSIDFIRWHKLVVDAAPKRKQQTNEEDTLKTVFIEEGIECQLNTPVHVDQPFTLVCSLLSNLPLFSFQQQ